LGSWVRNDMPADSLSDLDLVVIVSDPSVFLSEASWLLTFGEPCLTFVEPTAIGNFRERRVSFRDGRVIDFSLVPVAAIQQMISVRAFSGRPYRSEFNNRSLKLYEEPQSKRIELERFFWPNRVIS
jgi:hypothetical protein